MVPDLGGEFNLSQYDQRHRAVFNAIWQVGRGFQVSGPRAAPFPLYDIPPAGCSRPES